MTGHAMKYAQMSERVRAELDGTAYYEIGGRLAIAEDEIVAAETALVTAYRRWRDAMRAAADAGNKRAAEYLKRTTWDLT
jgi:hypothetical protein